MHIKRIFIIIVLCCVFVNVKAQDFIVTTSFDTINCKIVDIRNDTIYYTYYDNGEFVNRPILISRVQNYQLQTPLKVNNPKSSVRHYSESQHFRIAMSGGYGYYTAKLSEEVPDDYEDYANDLRSGLSLEGDFTFYFSKVLGIGLMSGLFRSTGSLDDVHIEDRISNTYIGPSISLRAFDNQSKNHLDFYLTVGYMGYSDKITRDYDYTMKSHTVGLGFGLGYDRDLIENIALGIKVSYFGGLLHEYELDYGESTKIVELDEGELESLNRINISAGVRFNF